jgi:hypothetical protein
VMKKFVADANAAAQSKGTSICSASIPNVPQALRLPLLSPRGRPSRPSLQQRSSTPWWTSA